MSTCAECLRDFSTMPIAELKRGSSVAEHCATCPDCASVVEEASYAERRLASALADAGSVLSPEDLSRQVLDKSERVRRKEVGRWVRGILLAAGCVTFWFFMDRVFVPWADGRKRTVTETITLKCLSAQQASEIATPYLRSRGSAIYTAKDIHTVTIRGRADEFRRARLEVTGVDDRQHCDLSGSDIASQRAKFEADRKAAHTTSIDKPGKD